MAIVRTSFANAFLVLSAAFAILLLFGALVWGAGIMYVGAGIAAVCGALLATTYLLISRQPWKIKSVGAIALAINVIVFGWLWLMVPG